MATQFIEEVGRGAASAMAAWGAFWRFVGHTVAVVFAPRQLRDFRLILPQLYEVGVTSVPVVGITGMFIGMVLGIESYTQFKAIGQEARLGAIINVSVVKQIGPVLAAVMLAGRVGGAMTAELGTMNVTEQLDALRVMGTDPIRILVAPRFLACILLMPMLTVYSDILGMFGGWLIAVKSLGIPSEPYWRYSNMAVENWTILEGLFKSLFFGAAIALIGCYKGFTCGSGASGVGKACTESFVASFISIIVLNFFFAKVAKDWYVALYGLKGFLGG